MQRELSEQSMAWPDKTMSLIRQRQLEACEERLATLPAFGVFQGCTDANAEELWRVTYEAQEQLALPRLHTQRELEEQVMARLPVELLLLPIHEYELLGRAMLNPERTPLMDWHECAPAESLVRRLLCVCQIEEDDTISLRVAPEVSAAIYRIASDPVHIRLREQVSAFYLTVMAALNVYGAMWADEAEAYLRESVLTGTAANDRLAVQRMLKTAFDYVYDADGRMVLLHPGVADPQAMLPFLCKVKLADFAVEDDEEEIPQMLISDTERTATVMVAGVLEDALRPDLNVWMAAEDLRVMAKQGVSLETMREVLASQLEQRPTAVMLAALQLMRAEIPAWICLPQARKLVQ